MTGPMHGVRVVELGVWVAGPSAGGILCDWGADVVKLEPHEGDPFRALGAAFGIERLPPPFELDNRGKRSVAIDLRRDESRDVVTKLLQGADVFLTNMRPGAVERLGLDYASVRAINDSIIYAQVSAYGGDSPDSDRAAFDVGAFWSRGGVAGLLRTPDGQLPSQRGGMGDHFTGANAVGAIAAALFHRERSGEGQLVSTSLLRTATYMLGWDYNSYLRSGIEPQPTDRATIINPLINSYQLADGEWVWLLMLQGDRHWPEFCRAIDREAWPSDERYATLAQRAVNASTLIAEIEGVLAARTLEEWAPVFDEHDVWWAPVQTPEQVLNDPTVEQAGAWVEVPEADGSTGRMVASAVDFGGTPWSVRAPTPELGQHTEEVLLDLGLEWDGIAELKDAGVIP
jgi:crotonobetainyl-CoA:carnitine CoA-transferase CaiB-like acyl-CoA transferase